MDNRWGKNDFIFINSNLTFPIARNRNTGMWVIGRNIRYSIPLILEEFSSLY